MGTATYETDVIAWAQEQVRLLRAGRFDALDIEHIADQIEDVVGRTDFFGGLLSRLIPSSTALSFL